MLKRMQDTHAHARKHQGTVSPERKTQDTGACVSVCVLWGGEGYSWEKWAIGECIANAIKKIMKFL